MEGSYSLPSLPQLVKRNPTTLSHAVYDLLYVDGLCSAEEHRRMRAFSIEAEYT